MLVSSCISDNGKQRVLDKIKVFGRTDDRKYTSIRTQWENCRGFKILEELEGET